MYVVRKKYCVYGVKIGGTYTMPLRLQKLTTEPPAAVHNFPSSVVLLKILIIIVRSVPRSHTLVCVLCGYRNIQ